MFPVLYSNPLNHLTQLCLIRPTSLFFWGIRLYRFSFLTASNSLSKFSLLSFTSLNLFITIVLLSMCNSSMVCIPYRTASILYSFSLFKSLVLPPHITLGFWVLNTYINSVKIWFSAWCHLPFSWTLNSNFGPYSLVSFLKDF